MWTCVCVSVLGCVCLNQVNSKWQRKVKVKIAIRESARRVSHTITTVQLYTQINKQQQQKERKKNNKNTHTHTHGPAPLCIDEPNNKYKVAVAAAAEIASVIR